MTTPEFEPELFEKWVDALESGEYAQGKHVLRSNDNKFCCLGVAADKAGVKWIERQATCYVFRDHNDSFWSGNLPEDLGARLGFDDHISAHLIDLNDDHGATFHQIAAYLRDLRANGSIG